MWSKNIPFQIRNGVIFILIPKYEFIYILLINKSATGMTINKIQPLVQYAPRVGLRRNDQRLRLTEVKWMDGFC
jgi:hypothetical protein